MATVTADSQHETPDTHPESHAAAEKLRSWFGADFRLLDAGSMRRRYPPPEELPDEEAMARQIAAMTWQEGPQLLPQLGPLLRLVLPIQLAGRQRRLAIGTFVRRRVSAGESVADAAVWLDMDDAEAAAWINAQPLWTADTLLRCGHLAMEKFTADQDTRRLERDVEDVTANLVATYEEITFLYQVTERLARSDSTESLLDYLLQWLVEFLPAEAIVCQVLPPEQSGGEPDGHRHGAALLTRGQCPLGGEQLQRFIGQVAARVKNKPYVFNRDEATDAGQRAFPELNQLIIVPLQAGGCVFGWIAAMNNPGGQWFGTVQARLLQCVATVLGMLSDNVRLSAQWKKLECEKRAAESQAQRLGDEVGHLSQSLELACEEVSRSYEETNLLYRLAQNMSITESVEELSRHALNWLTRVLPVKGIVIYAGAAPRPTAAEASPWRPSTWVTDGECPIDLEQFQKLIDETKLADRIKPLVVNQPLTDEATWLLPRVRQLLVVPVEGHGRLFGWVAALNHVHDEELGTVEAGLLSSVAVLLGLQASFRLSAEDHGKPGAAEACRDRAAEVQAGVDRRKWERFTTQLNSPRDVAVLIGGCEMHLGSVLNESVGGLGLLMPGAARFTVGKKIEVYYRNTNLRAIVRRVEQRDDGKLNVGVQLDCIKR